MLKIIGNNRKFNVFDSEKNNNILAEDYNHIEIQQYGIVARKDIEGTFLDHRYDLYNLNGDLLFSQTEKYDGNYVTEYNYRINKHFVELVVNSTPDYDKYSHDTDTWSEYYHLDGRRLNIDNKEINDIVCINNLGIIDTSNKDEYFYDFKKEKVVFKKSDFINQITPLVSEIIAFENNNYEKLKIEYVLNNKNNIAKKWKLNGKDEIIFNKLCNNSLKSKNFYHKEYDTENSPISNALYELWNAWDNVKNAKSETGLLNYSGFEGSEVSVLLHKNKNINLVNESFWAGHGNNLEENYIELKLFNINYKTFEIKVYKNNIEKLKKYYEKVTGKKSNLNLENVNLILPENEEELLL